MVSAAQLGFDEPRCVRFVTVGTRVWLVTAPCQDTSLPALAAASIAQQLPTGADR